VWSTSAVPQMLYISKVVDDPEVMQFMSLASSRHVDSYFGFLLGRVTGFALMMEMKTWVMTPIEGSS